MSFNDIYKMDLSLDHWLFYTPIIYNNFNVIEIIKASVRRNIASASKLIKIKMKEK